MEERGIMVNAKALQELSIYFDSEIRQIEARIFELAGEEFNVGSPKQIGEILFDRQGLKGKKRLPAPGRPALISWNSLPNRE